MDYHLIDIIIIVFFTTLIVSVLCRQLRLPVIFGYLLAGALMGPHFLAIVPDSPIINTLAEFGIVFLMFTVGLEFSLPKLLTLQYKVLGIGIFQVILTILITTLMGFILGMTALAAFVVGSIVAMSSTALVVKQLNDQLELHSPYGLNTVGILLIQDLAVIPLIIVIASFAKNSAFDLSSILLWAGFKSIIGIFIILLMGRWLLKPLFRLISRTEAPELFTLTVLLVTFTSAWITNLFGLSYALGAFLAGMMLSETEFCHQIEIEIRPFRDILVGLFFISIGMLTDVLQWYQHFHWVLLLLIAIILGKMLLVFVISRIAGNPFNISLRTGLILAQGGEFGLAILTLALNHNIFSPEYGQVILAALLISMAFSPLLISFNKQIANLLLMRPSHFDKENSSAIFETEKPVKDHVIICGYGRVGQNLARLLEKVNFPYIAIDLDVELVERAVLAGESVIYGNATHPDILKRAAIENAKVLVISFNNLEATTHILGLLREEKKQVPILVRCHDEFELKQLQKLGAKHIVAELFEESLSLSYYLLHLIHISSNKISALIDEIRHKNYKLLYKIFIGSGDTKTLNASATLYEQLKPIVILPNTYAVNKKIKDLPLTDLGVEVFALRRSGKKPFKPNRNLKIYPNDIIILFGTEERLLEAEHWLLKGK